MTTELPVLKASDYATNQEVRWCPGCGDYSILAQTRKTLAAMQIPKENTVFISGIGCSSRFPYYMNTYGMHSIHGRAPGFATGLKAMRQDLQVWVITGDGDGLSIGGNHLMHCIRRNMNLTIVLFNNRIYGLTKGQYSPTSCLGHVTKSSPMGTIDNPLHPLSIALGCEATFIARSVDVYPKHLTHVLQRAAEHCGTAFVEVYQNCVVFNDGAWKYATDRKIKSDSIVELEHDKPLIFGKNRDKGIRFSCMKPEIVTLGDDVAESDLMVHDETFDEPYRALMLSRMHHPEYPEPIGIFRAVKRPCYDLEMTHQIEQAEQQLGPGNLESLFHSGDTWTVE